jgi:Ca2+-binding RTX toxin-like protein
VSDDFARVEGGAGADTLRGGPKSEILDGGPGADKVLGGAGNNNLTGGEGADVVRGGPGRDVVNVHDYNGRPSDNISCGRGRDALNYDLDPADVVHRDCERIASVGGGLPLTPTFKSTSAGSYVAPCRSIGNGRRTRCTAHVVLTDRLGRLLAEGRASMRAAPYHGIRIHTGHLRVTVWLTSLGRRTLLSGIGVVISERVAFEERIPGLGVAPSRPRFRVAWS